MMLQNKRVEKKSRILRNGIPTPCLYFYGFPKWFAIGKNSYRKWNTYGLEPHNSTETILGIYLIEEIRRRNRAEKYILDSNFEIRPINGKATIEDYQIFAFECAICTKSIQVAFGSIDSESLCCNRCFARRKTIAGFEKRIAESSVKFTDLCKKKFIKHSKKMLKAIRNGQ